MQSDNTRARICIVLPIYNEEAILKHSVARLHTYCKDALAHIDWTIIIADNGSTDSTSLIAQRIASEHVEILYDSIPVPGRGGSLQHAWSLADADIYFYMDCDLATDLCHVRECIDAIMSGDYDIAIGSRLLKKSSTQRSLLRECCSRLYSFLPTLFFPSFPIRDCQCGFKAISHTIKKEVLPAVQDRHWFFDTELLIRSFYAHYRIVELPVCWKDQRFAERKSKVRLIRTAIGNCIKLFLLKKNPDLRH